MLLQNAPIVREWVGLRPTRKTVRIEHEVMKFPSGNLQVTFCESIGQYCKQILAVKVMMIMLLLMMMDDDE